MENKTLQTLLVAQVLTLAKTQELLEIEKAKNGSHRLNVNYEQEAVKLINRRSAEVLQWLGQTPQP